MRGTSVITALVLAWTLTLVSTGRAVACSAPFERPTIRALGPGQIVVLGTVGELVAGGRLFHVERWFNGSPPGTPIVIGFKEGEPVGDCSYPVATGERKIIAPVRMPDGTLYADLGTLQADPATADGQLYVAEAESLFGPGVVPEPLPSREPVDEGGPPMLLLIAAGVVGAALAVVLAVRGRREAPCE